MKPTTNPISAEIRVLTNQASNPPIPSTSSTCFSRSWTKSYGACQPELLGADEQDVATDPQHRGRADDRQGRQQLGHAGHHQPTDAL